MNDDTIQRALNLIEQAEYALSSARTLLKTSPSSTSKTSETTSQDTYSIPGAVYESEEGRIVEGEFDGQNMIGPDGKRYSIPANYASKSKLVCGDRLKLTITDDGRFMYKQIGPVERERVKGVLIEDEQSSRLCVLAEGKVYHILTASLTFFRAELGDEVIILVPQGRECSWAAVENVIKDLPAHTSYASLETEDDPELLSPLDDLDTL